MNRAWIASLMSAGMAGGAGYAWMNGMAAPQLVQMGAMGLAAGGMIAGMARRMGPPKVQAKAQDKWASEAALERAGLLHGDGIVLGRMGERYVTLQRPGHALVIGGTRSGKTSGVIVPTLLNWTGSMLVFDPKGELWETTSGWRAAFSDCLRFDPSDPDSIRYNPLLAIREGPHQVGDTQKIVQIIANPGKTDHDSGNPFWRESASQWLTAVILHVLHAESVKTIERVRTLAMDFTGTTNAMQKPSPNGKPPHGECERVAKAMQEMDEKTRSGVQTTATSWLTLWADEMVARATSASDFDMGDLMCRKRPVSLYLSSPLSEQSRLEGITRIMLRQMAAALTADLTHDLSGRKKKHDLLLCLEEFPQLGRMRFMEQLLAAGAGYGIRALMAAQSTSQLVEAYGRDHSILSNLEAFLAIPSVDTAENERIAEMVGRSLEYRASYSRKAGTFEGSTTWSEQIRRAMETDEIRELASDRIFLFTRSLKPALLVRAHDEDEAIRPHKLKAAKQGKPLLPEKGRGAENLAPGKQEQPETAPSAAAEADSPQAPAPDHMPEPANTSPDADSWLPYLNGKIA